MSKKGLVLVISGPSGCGKGTVLKALMAQQDDIFLSVSATTRNPREGEVNGENYFFITKEDFKSQVEKDEMLEYATYCDNMYGTPKAPVYARCDKGQDVILEIEVQGAMQVKEKNPDVVTIFIMPPSLEELKRRLVDRATEDMETVNKRISTADGEIKLAKDYDYIVVNDTVEQAVIDIKSIIRAEKCSNKRV